MNYFINRNRIIILISKFSLLLKIILILFIIIKYFTSNEDGDLTQSENLPIYRAPPYKILPPLSSSTPKKDLEIYKLFDKKEAKANLKN